MINIITCMFVLDSVENTNKKKNDEKELKLLVNKDGSLLNEKFDFSDDIKAIPQKDIKNIIGSSNFSLVQVYTLGDKKYVSDKKIDVIYLGITNIENIKKLSNDYKLIPISICANKEIILDSKSYKYKTIKNDKNGSEYIHKISIDDIILEKELLEILIAYKYLRTHIDNTNMIFKLLPKMFTLEDVKIVYEMIKDIKVDKSNFRKKIINYVKKTETVVRDKGYRPTSLYEYNKESDEIWL